MVTMITHETLTQFSAKSHSVFIQREYACVHCFQPAQTLATLLLETVKASTIIREECVDGGRALCTSLSYRKDKNH